MEVWEPIKSKPETAGLQEQDGIFLRGRGKGWPLALGMHKRGSFYDIVSVEGLQDCG